MKTQGFQMVKAFCPSVFLCAGVLAALLPSESRARAGAPQGVACDATGIPHNAARLVRVTEQSMPSPDAIGVSGGVRTFIVAWPVRSEASVSPADRPVVGGDVRILRCLPQGRWEVVGAGRALRANGLQVEAQIEIPLAPSHGQADTAHTADASDRSDGGFGRGDLVLAVRGNSFPRPMAGDVIVPVRHEARPVARINPKRRLDAALLFQGDALTDHGRDLLRAELARFARTSGRLAVESHLLQPGDRDALRRLSQLRADAVAQFLARELGVDGDRVVALGFGSDAWGSGMREVARWPDRDFEEEIILRVIH